MICVCVSSFSQRFHGNLLFSRTCKYSSSKYRRLIDKDVNYFTTTTKKEARILGMKRTMKRKNLLINRDVYFRSSTAQNVKVA